MAFPTFSLDPKLFDPASISEATHKFNGRLQEIMNSGPKWYEVGAPKYRQMRAAGETPLPAAVYLPTASEITIPSRDPSRLIPCRVLKPTTTNNASKAVYMHIHGGGWVLQDHQSQDPVLQLLANDLSLTCVSIGYRLAPENPFPAGPHDCYDAAEYLITHSPALFNCPLSFVGGESAGGHLSLLTALHILQHPSPSISQFPLKGLILNFGCYSFTWLPSVYTFDPTPILVLNRDLMDHYVSAFLPSLTEPQKRDPAISPLFADLAPLRGRLPPALFTCGTYDCLLDDTVLMSAKWAMHGGETVVKIVPGAPHGYIMFPREMEGSGAEEGMSAVEEFVKRKLEGV